MSVEILGDLDVEYFSSNEWTDQWFYLPGSEFAILGGGIQLWHDLREQEPINATNSPKI